MLPTTPRASMSLLMSAIQKDSLLQNTPSPRIIFIGGSNLSFGLNSQIIKDSLKLNPINTAIHASIGIKYMLENTLKYIKKGDVVLLVPEYSHYYRDTDCASEELMRTIFDVDITRINLLNANQLLNIMPFLPKYALSKFKIKEYLNIEESDVYSVNSFNIFGDTYTHWEMQKQEFQPYEQIKEQLNYETIILIKKFYKDIKQKEAILLISYPCYQATSFDNSINQIQKVEQLLEESELPIIGTANRYKIPEYLMFNTPYHLNKKGVDYRTKLLIEDVKKAKSLNQIKQNDLN